MVLVNRSSSVASLYAVRRGLRLTPIKIAWDLRHRLALVLARNLYCRTADPNDEVEIEMPKSALEKILLITSVPARMYESLPQEVRLNPDAEVTITRRVGDLAHAAEVHRTAMRALQKADILSGEELETGVFPRFIPERRENG